MAGPNPGGGRHRENRPFDVAAYYLYDIGRAHAVYKVRAQYTSTYRSKTHGSLAYKNSFAYGSFFFQSDRFVLGEQSL